MGENPELNKDETIIRKIKFRGKRVDNGKWVRGYGIKISISGTVIIYDKNELEWFEVIPETVGEYTGCRDKNCKEIYEGDIVKFPSFYDDTLSENFSAKNPQICEVIRKNGCYGVIPNADYQFFHEFYSFSKMEEDIGIEQDDIEIIGNIYENPEKVI